MAKSSTGLPLIEPLSIKPLDAFERLSAAPKCLYLDSSQRHEELGRYSFMAIDPYDSISVGCNDPAAPALERLRDELDAIATPAVADLPPFQGGAAGMFGYELGHAFEQLPRPEFDEFEMPALSVGFYDVVLAFDHHSDNAWIISQGFPEREWEARHARAQRRLQELKSLLARKCGSTSPIRPCRPPALW